MAALYRFVGSLSVAVHASAAVDSEGRATYNGDINRAISMVTGTGSSSGLVDMAYVDDIEIASGAGAAAIDLRALAQAGNTMVMVVPKYIVLNYISGDGTFFLDRGATNGYTGFPADGCSVDALRPVAVIPVRVSTGSGDKTIHYSETSSAGSVEVGLIVLGSSV